MGRSWKPIAIARPTARCSPMACGCSAGHGPKSSWASKSFRPWLTMVAGSYAPCQASDETDHESGTAAWHGGRRPDADCLSAPARHHDGDGAARPAGWRGAQGAAQARSEVGHADGARAATVVPAWAPLARGP